MSKSISCPNCTRTIKESSLYKHSKTDKCKTPIQPHEKYSSIGTKYIDCPCGHDLCSGKVQERTVYRHLKYLIHGINSKRINKSKELLERLKNDKGIIYLFN